MPSEIGYSLPPANQRPQIFSRVDATEPRTSVETIESRDLEQSGVELKQTQVVGQTREVFDDRFPSEGGVERFRGNTEGRSLDSAVSGESISQLPNRVQPFSALTARSNEISSFSVAEAAAQGVITPNERPSLSAEPIAPIIGGSVAFDSEAAEDSDQQITQASSKSDEPRQPSINGSGEISKRFEEISEQIALRSEDDLSSQRPGGEASERVSEERVEARVNREDADASRRTERQGQDLVRVIRAQELDLQDEAVVSRQAEQRLVDDRINESSANAQAGEQGGQPQGGAQSGGAADPNNNARPAEAREPGAPTNSSGEPLSSEEQQEVERLARRDREVRAHEQAHARAGGAHVRGGVQLSLETGPDGKQYAVDGEVNIDLSAAQSPQQTIAKMRQVQSAALAPANPSGADRAVASLAARRELDARAQLAEESRENREQVSQEQGSGAPASVNEESERAGAVEQTESVSNLAGAQSVIPDPSFAPSSSGVDQQSLDYAYSAGFTLSAPPETSRPVAAPTSSVSVNETPETPASQRVEGESDRHDEVASLAIDRGWHG